MKIILRLLPSAVILFWVMAALFTALLPMDPFSIHLHLILQPPGEESLFGYDDLGRPLLDRVVAGAATSLLVAIPVVLITLIIGVMIGSVSAVAGGWVDHVLSRFMDIILAFPGILLAILLAGILGPGINNVIIALSLVGWVGFARLTRAQILSIKQRDHVLAASALGVTNTTITVRHLLPLAMVPIMVEATFGIASVIVAEAGLSFLGLGVQPPQPSWGSMIRDGVQYLIVAPHMVIIPGLALASIVFAVNIVGDQLRDKFDVTGK